MFKKLLIILFIFFPYIIKAQTDAYLITGSIYSSSAWGDNLHYSIYDIKIPNTSSPIFIRAFDPATSIDLDEIYGDEDTKFKFELLEKSGSVYVSIDSIIISNEEQYRKKWATLFSINQPKNEYRLIVKGISGNDINLYNFVVSDEFSSNLPSNRVKISSKNLGLRLPFNPLDMELQFIFSAIPKKLFVNIFDLDSDCSVEWTQPFGIINKLSIRGNDIEKSAELKILPENNYYGFHISKNFMPNDNLRIRFTNEDVKEIDIPLPVVIKPKPVISKPEFKYETMSDVLEFLFDALPTITQNISNVQFDWDFGDGNNAKGLKVTHSYSKSGKYNVSLIISENYGFVYSKSKLTKMIKVNELPVSQITLPEIGSPNETITFNASLSSDPDGKIVRYVWDFGDGNSAEGLKVQHKYVFAGDYIVTLTVYDDYSPPYNSSKTNENYKVNAQPTPKFISDLIANINEVLTFDASHSTDWDNPSLIYNWSFGDGKTEQGKNVKHGFSKPGVYEVELTINDGSKAKNAIQSLKKKITVNTQPVADLKFINLVSANEDILFDASSSYDRDGNIVKYEWDFGDGTTYSGRSREIHQYEKPGSYDVTLTVTDNFGKPAQASITKTIIVNVPPISDFSLPSVSTKPVITFDASQSSDADQKIVDYSWDFGDGKYGKGKIVEHFYSYPGTYTVTLAVKDNSSTSTALTKISKQIIVNQPPVADAGESKIGIIGEQIVFDASNSFDPDGSISDYEWDFGDGANAKGQKVIHTYSKSGRYSVLLKVRDNTLDESSISTAEIEVFINQSPTAKIEGPKTIAPNQQVTYTSESSFDSDGKIIGYDWFINGKKVASSPKLTYKFNESGAYTLELFVTDDSKAKNSVSSTKEIIFVNHKPIAKSHGDIIQNSLTVVFDASNSYDPDEQKLSYTWNLGDGTIREGKIVTHTYKKFGSYIAKLIVDDNQGLSNSKDIFLTKVNLNQPPVAKIKANIFGCAGEPVIFDASESFDAEKGRLKYEWSFGDGETSNELNPFHTYQKGGTYSVKLKVTDDSGLKDNFATAIHSIKIADAPVAKINLTDRACANTAIPFDGSLSTGGGTDIQTYRWNFGDGSEENGKNVTHSYLKAGKYRVTLTVTTDKIGNCNNQATASKEIIIDEAPKIDFSAPKLVAVNDTIKIDWLGLNESNQEISYSISDGTVKKVPSFIHVFTKPGIYTIEGKVKVVDRSECNEAVLIKKVEVNDAPVPVISIRTLGGQKLDDIYIGDVLELDANLSKDSDGFITSYNWEIHSKTFNGTSVLFPISETGQINIKLTVKDNANVKNSVTKTTQSVFVKTIPDIQVKIPGVVCIGEQITGSVELTGQALNVVKIILPDGKDLQANSFQWNATETGQVSFNFLVLNTDLSRIINSKKYSVNVVEFPKISLKSEWTTVTGESTLLWFESIKKDLRSEWLINNNSFTGYKIAPTFSTSGNFNGTLLITDPSIPCASKTYNFSVKVIPKLEANINVVENSEFVGSANDKIILSAIIPEYFNNYPLQYEWEVGNGDKVEGKTVTYQYKKAGKYTIRLTVIGNAGEKLIKGTDAVSINLKQR